MADRFLRWTPVILLALLSFSVKAKATALGFLAILFGLSVAFGGRLWRVRLEPGQGCAWACSLFPWVFVLLVFAQLLGKVFAGEHGVDFVIFAQSISTAAQGVATTTMVGLEPVPFLTHHFAPAIYLLGAVCSLGVPGYLVGIGAQVGSLAVGLWLLFRLSRWVGLSRVQSWVGVTLLCVAHPALRQGLSWSIHDELFSLAFVVLAVWFGVRRSYAGAVASLLATLVFKETFFLFAVTLPVGLLFLERRREERGEVLRWFCGPAMLGVAGFVVFFLLKGDLPGTTFNPVSRLASWSELLDFNVLAAKGDFLFRLLLPSLGLALWSREGRAVLVMAAPFWGLPLLSNFPEMWKCSNYYAVIPAVLLHVGAVLTLGRWKVGTKDWPLAGLVLALCLAIGLGNQQLRPIKVWRQVLAGPVLWPGSLTFIPRGSRVIASEFDALYAPEGVVMLRLWTASRLPTRYDAVLERKPAKEPIPPHLLKGTHLCFENELWRLHCREGTSPVVPVRG